MKNSINSAALGALVREARETARFSQTQLAERIGASRFWVAAFEKGKPSAELGLALKAIQALGLTLHIGHPNDQPVQQTPTKESAKQPIHPFSANLDRVIANATLSNAAKSSVVGWPTAGPTHSKSARKTAPRKRQRQS
ncbi:MAG: helix-turn-helix domain-containing protein [Gemmatimonadaceae bacterium]